MKQLRDTAVASGDGASTTEHAPAEVPAMPPEIIAGRRKQQDDAARHRQVKREAEDTTGNGAVQRNVEPPKRHRLDSLVDYPKRPNSGSRRTETPPVPRHVNASSSCNAPLTVCSSLLFVV